MDKRTIHAMQIEVDSPTYVAFMVWPDHIPEDPCARLLDSRKPWLTAARRDTVMVKLDVKSTARPDGLWMRYGMRVPMSAAPNSLNPVDSGNSQGHLAALSNVDRYHKS